MTCQICGKEGKKIIFKKEIPQLNKDFGVSICVNCGFGETVPSPSKTELAEMYKNYYTEKLSDKKTFNFNNLIKCLLFKGIRQENILPIRFLCLKLLRKLIQIVLPTPFGTKRVLDVGCGYGRLLDFFAMSGWQTYGVEPGPRASSFARQKGHNIFTGEIRDAKYQPNYFSAIIFCHSLEHISNPIEVLNEAYRILEPGGILIIEVPNIMCVDAKLFDSSWHAWELPFHVCHWTPISLKKVLVNLGFNIDYWKFKIPRVVDCITNLRNSKRDGYGIPLTKIIFHFLKTWLLGHLGINLQCYGHFMTVYARKQKLNILQRGE